MRSIDDGRHFSEHVDVISNTHASRFDPYECKPAEGVRNTWSLMERRKGKKKLRKDESETRNNKLELIPCEICGKQLRPRSIYSHTRFIHSNQNVKRSNQKLISKTLKNKKVESDVYNDKQNYGVKKMKYLSRITRNDVTDLIPCEVCGKQLRPNSLYAHMRFIHSNINDKPSNLEIIEDIQEAKKDDFDVLNGKRYTSLRKSKCRANAILKTLLDDNDHSDKKLIKTFDKDFVLEENIPSSDSDLGSEENYSSDEYDFKTNSTNEILNLENKKITKTERLLREWKGKYKILKQELKPITKEMKDNWKLELETSGIIYCKTEGCNKQFTSVLGVIYHTPRCQNDQNFECLICLKQFKYTKTSLLAHMKNYHNNYSEGGDKANDTRFRKLKCSSKLFKYTAKEAFKFHLKYALTHSQSEIFNEWKPKLQDWKLLSESIIQKYLPLQKKSANIKIRIKEETKMEWFQLELFKTAHITDGDFQRLFYVGGPVWASAWCPTAVKAKSKQYIALSCCRDSNKIHNFIPTKLECTMIQLWDVGFLENNQNNIKEFIPPTCIGIAIDYGEIWDMEWCPNGCWEDSSLFKNTSSDEILPRLGLLAVACSDSCVRIYSIPHPEFLMKNESNINIYETKAIILKPSMKQFNSSDKLGVCTCVTWQKTNNCRFLAGGFANGLICIWDLCATSQLLKFVEDNQTVIYSYLSFSGASANITGIAWAPFENKSLLASTSAERNLKIWDLENPNWPVYIYKHGLFQALSWQPTGIFFSTDYCYKNYNNSTSFLDFEEFHSYPVCVHNGCIWNISVSGWKNMVVSCDSSGELVGVILHRLDKDRSHQWHFRMPLYRLELELLKKISSDEELISFNEMEIQSPISVDSGIQEENPKKEEKKETIKSLSPKQTYEEITANYGIVIKEFRNVREITSNDTKRLQSSKSMNFANMNDYPLTSINTVCWNPNLDYHCWLFSSGQAGLANLIYVSGTSTEELKNSKWYKRFS